MVAVASSCLRYCSTLSFSSCLIVDFFPRNFHDNTPDSKPYVNALVIILSAWPDMFSVVSFNLLKYSLMISPSDEYFVAFGFGIIRVIW